MGGLVPAHTKIDHLLDAAHHADGGPRGKLGKIKLSLVKILGTCMDFGSSTAASLPCAGRIGTCADVSRTVRPPILDRTLPRPPAV